MKSQRAVYLLLPLVLLIWGFIGWRVWSATEEDAVPARQLPVVADAAALADSTYRPALLLTYTDPFGPVPGATPAAAAPGASYAAPVPIAPRVTAGAGLSLPVRPPVTTPAAPTVTWPAVSYLGVIAHAEGKAQVALLTVNSEETAIKVGRSVQGVEVVKLFRDSVRLSFNKQQRTFFRAAISK